MVVKLATRRDDEDARTMGRRVVRAVAEVPAIKKRRASVLLRKVVRRESRGGRKKSVCQRNGEVHFGLACWMEEEKKEEDTGQAHRACEINAGIAKTGQATNDRGDRDLQTRMRCPVIPVPGGPATSW